MILHQITYKEYEAKSNEWQLTPVRFELLNLLVGKNASGKSRTLSVINGLAQLLSGDIKLGFQSGDYSVLFRNGDDHYEYRLHYEEAKVVLEEFKKNNRYLLQRKEGGIGMIFAEKAAQEVEFQTPVSELACVSRRDSIQHPYFEVLHEWAKGVRLFRFGTPLGKDSYVVVKGDMSAQFDPRETDKVISVFRRGKKEFGQPFVDGILHDMASIGYDLENVDVQTPTGIVVQSPTPVELIGLFVKEKDLSGVTEQMNMSQGMFRALSIVIQLNFSQRTHRPSCILIDDIGEGLDFDRSCSLIELIISKAQIGNVQLLMSTNDRFVMNKVPLQYWALIQRKGGICQIFNNSNSREKFEAFKFTGMNNFDFFATNFIESES